VCSVPLRELFSDKIPMLDIFDKLHARFGPQHWWPGETPFEVMVGAILTQNTNWTNVSRAIATLREYNLLSFDALNDLSPDMLAEYIRPAGYYRLKAGRLKNLLILIRDRFDGDPENLFALDVPAMRRELLSVSGIGPETADSIILYAAEKPIFVVDAYTHRMLCRHDRIDEDADYHAIQELFMDTLPEDVALYNEFHALIVRLGKEFCKKSKPRCQECPLLGL